MPGKPDPIYGDLPHGWAFVSLDDLSRDAEADIQTGPFGTLLHASAYRETGTPVVAVKNIGENRLVEEDIPRVDDETRERLSRYQLRTGDILFGRKGSVERRAYVHEGQEGWLQGSDCIRLRLRGQRADARFVSYTLGTPQCRNWIIQNAHGATMPSLNQEIIGRIPVPLPPLREQQAIACILGALDDKIELNRRMNRTLEGLARAIFQSWFVDFDPVRWNVQGRHAKPQSRKADKPKPPLASSCAGDFAFSPGRLRTRPDPNGLANGKCAERSRLAQRRNSKDGGATLLGWFDSVGVREGCEPMWRGVPDQHGKDYHPARLGQQRNADHSSAKFRRRCPRRDNGTHDHVWL
jgi:type I restriction enzyme S subunit